MGDWILMEDKGKKKAMLSSNTIKLAQSETTSNYYCPLTCLVDKQEPMAQSNDKIVRSESTAEEKLSRKKAAVSISEVDRREIGAQYAPITDDLEKIMEEELNEVLDMETTFEQKVK